MKMPFNKWSQERIKQGKKILIEKWSGLVFSKKVVAMVGKKQ